jgi:hypothetical protein
MDSARSMFAKTISDELVGETWCDFLLVEGGTLILCFGGLRPDAPKRLWIDCAWRVRDETRIRVASRDDSVLALPELRAALGAKTKSILVDPISGDLQLTFENAVTVELFCHAILDETWQYRRQDSYRLGIGPNCVPFEKWDSPDKR